MYIYRHTLSFSLTMTNRYPSTHLLVYIHMCVYSCMYMHMHFQRGKKKAIVEVDKIKVLWKSKSELIPGLAPMCACTSMAEI